MKYRYLIKCTYIDGPHAGKVYLLRKGGYVTDLKQYQDDSDTYASRGFAQRVCDKMQKENTSEFNFERLDNQYRVDRGLSKPKKDNEWLYWHESYEPVRVDPQTDQADWRAFTQEELNSLNESLKW